MLSVRNSHCLAKRDGFIQGCLVTLLVLLILAIIGGIVVAVNFRNWSAEAGSAAARAMIDSSDLPDAEKPDLKLVIDDLRDQYKAGNVTFAEVQEIFSQLDRSPVLAMGAVFQFQGMYVTPSTLSDEEKANATLELNRLAQAVSVGAVKWEDLPTILKPIAYQKGNHIDFQKPETVSNDELKAAIAHAAEAADKAGIPDERVEIDLSDELRKHIAATLGRPLGTPQAKQP